MTKEQSFGVSKRRIIQNVFTLLLITVLQLVLTQKPVLAHAILIRSTPADGAALKTAPGAIELWFSEPIATHLSLVRLLDETNQPVAGVSLQTDQPETDYLRMTVPALKTGGYTLFWMTLAETDGHASQGFVVFRVGTAAVVPQQLQPSTAAFPPLTEGGLRWLNFLFLTSVVGVLAVVQFVLTPVKALAGEGAQRAQRTLHRRVLRWAAAGAVGALLTGIGLLAWQVALVQASAPAGVNWLDQGWIVLTQTRWGTLWLVRQAVLLWLGGGLWLMARGLGESDSSWARLAVFGRAIDLLVIQALSGHALESSLNWVLALVNATVHLLAASLWMGGLLALAVLVGPALRQCRGDNTEWQAVRWRAFSLLAALSVGLLVVSGLVSMGQQVASLDALITTAYGQLLLGKIGLVMLAALCGLGNALLVHPTLAAPLARWLARPLGWTPLPLGRLPHLIALEVAFGILIFALTGLLTAAAPPRGVEFTLAPENVHPVLVQRVDDLLVTLEVKPNRPGQNLFRIRAVNTANPTSTEPFQVWLRFNPAAASQPGEDNSWLLAPSEKSTPQTYQVTSEALKQAGSWPIEVMTRRDGKEESIATFQWVMPPGELQPTLLSKYPLAKLLMPVAALLLFLVVLAGGGLRWLSSQRIRSARRRNPVGQTSVIESM